VDRKDGEVTIRRIPLGSANVLQKELTDKKITTVERLLTYCVEKHGDKKVQGTRKVERVEKVTRDDGSEILKFHLGGYEWRSYQEMGRRVSKVGRGLRELGMEPRERLVVYADTSADWLVCALAAFQHSMTVVTLYTNLGVDGLKYGIQLTEVKLVIVGQSLLPRLESVLPDCPTVCRVVIIPGLSVVPTPANERYFDLEEVVRMGSQSKQSRSPPTPEDAAIIMFTSGSTGVPKGVVLSHANIIQALINGLPLSTALVGRVTGAAIGFLPLAHVMEQVCELFQILEGIPIGYSSLKTLTDKGTLLAEGSRGDAVVLKPSIMGAVPLMLEGVYKGIKEGASRKGPFFIGLLLQCCRYRQYWTRKGYDTPILNWLLFSKFRAILGGEVIGIVSGGAPLSPECHEFLRTVLCIVLAQGYACTETTASGCIMDEWDLSTGSVGSPFEGVDLKLVDWPEGGYTVNDKDGPRGEIVLGGAIVAKEYFAMPEKTNKDFFNEDGKRFFRTGDIGLLRHNGTIEIIDRKKDLVKMQLGEYIAPSKIEARMKLHPAIENICVFADPNRKYAVALVVPSQVHLTDIASKLGLDSSAPRECLCHNPKVLDHFLEILNIHGATEKLLKFEIPRGVFLVDEPWTTDNGMITAAMKLKRKTIKEFFADQIKALFDKPEGS